MAEFKISRIRYTWQGPWTTATSYIKDDIVRYGGSTWVCIRQHSAATFAADQIYIANIGDSAPSPAWVKMSDGFVWRSSWASSTLYNPGDIALYGGVLYLCATSHTSASDFATNNANWTVYTSADNWTSTWVAATRYGIGDVVKYNGIVYRCIIEHTSADAASGLESALASWEIVNEGIEYKGEWASTRRYRPNDLVKYGGTVFRCVTGHTSGSTFTGGNFLIEFPGFEYDSEWTVSTYYSVGDVVKHGGYLYRSNTNNVGTDGVSRQSTTLVAGTEYQITAINDTDFTVIGALSNTVGVHFVATGSAIGTGTAVAFYGSPSDAVYQPDGPPDWTIISKGINFAGEWAATSTYKTGDVVRRGGQLYVALVDTTDDGSSYDYLDSSNWELLVFGSDWKDFWQEDIIYAVGDLVTFNGITYRCIIEHSASSQNYPGDNGSGYEFWEILIVGSDQVGLRQRGDLLTYDLSRTIAGDQSTLNETNVPVGNNQELLASSGDSSAYYKVWGNTPSYFYVSSDDTVALDDPTDPNRGVNIFRPWRTIRFACEQIAAITPPVSVAAIKVLTGVYEEVLPIIVPANVTLIGDETRSVTVKPKPANDALQADSTYTIAVLDRIRSIISDIVIGNVVTKTTGNAESQVFFETTTETTFVSFDPKQYDTYNNELFQTVVTVTGGQGSAHTANDIIDLIDDAKGYIRYHIDGIGTDPVVTGNNTASTDYTFTNTVTVLEGNKAFIKAEAVAFMKETYPFYTFNPASCMRDVGAFIDAWKYDIIYTGNYKSVLAARYYANAVLGSEGEDMFYVRNATGIRNMTLTGLLGQLNPPLVNELYRRPTGGAYVSLDAGWGPDDDRTWISSRSPYIQNCCTFGYGVVGQKIDGALHNGGNKSIVSNDFTQIISDGIGCHVLNNGRAELVSVFTYYAQVGMFAEDGGIIRATNGNSSYGDFGALADGNDPSEVPKYASVDNRTAEAVVASAFAGEINDEVLLLEFSNAGQDYTQALYTFVGSGTGAVVVQEEYRDNAIFEMQVRNSPTDTGATEGGLGYTLLGNNAQTGTPYTIALASNDESEEAELLGLRIVITSGDGTGQYGIVHSFNPMTKQLVVYRESDGLPGWDHVIPGTPSVVQMTTNATYRFEPRITFDPPPYAAVDSDLIVSTSWANIVYGETTETYDNITATAGTGTTDEEVTPVPAIWDVTKVRRAYQVTLSDAGAGYLAGQTITIDGADVGGISVENDITITVTSVTDDSTNSVLTFTYQGIAQSGKFIATPASGTATVYSKDGDTWLDSSMPSSGNWKCLAAGDNKFVAIKTGSATAASSLDGISWTNRSMPSSKNWNSVVYGGGIFVAVAGDSNAGAISLNGTTWASMTLPTFGDSTINEWVDVAYGKNRFVAIANSQNISAVGTYDSLTETIDWDGHIMDVIDDSSSKDWVSVTFGNQRFVAITSTGQVGYSFDGALWYPATMPTQDGSTAMNWKKIRYGQGVFFAVCDTGSRDIGADVTMGPTSFAATSPDGIVWTVRTLSEELSWGAVAFGNPDVTLGDSTISNNRPMWIAVPSEASNIACKVFTGATAIGRAIVEGGSISNIKIWDSGSGYSSPPAYTITDPGSTETAYIETRIADGVLAQPTWVNRGNNYKTSSTFVSIFGDGYADIIPNGQFVAISGLTVLPSPGTQFRFRGEPDYFTVATIELESQQTDGTFTAVFRIGPTVDYDYDLQHGSQVEIRERYSQVRITGHDFLDVGTGNYVETNYPVLYSTGLYTNAPENEVVESNGGRVFYASTDQNGNFRTGELFSVEQATGIVTISADFFDLQGLTELALGGVRLGGSGSVVREFSTDPLFIQDSNNIVPTQRAIKSYLQTRLNIGGSDLLTASFIAGTVKVGPNLISNSAGLGIVFPLMTDFSGSAHISGTILAQSMFYKSFKDSM